MGFLSSIGIDWSHLCPVNTWTIKENGEKYSDDSPQYVIDETTQEKYFSKEDSSQRILCGELLIFSPIIHLIPLVTSVALRMLNVVVFYHFWKTSDSESADLKSRFYCLATDVFRILISPLGIPFFCLTAAYGIWKPKDGTKLHARMEKIFYGHALIALCFHPQPRETPKDMRLKNFQAILTNTLTTDPLIVIVFSVARVFLFLTYNCCGKAAEFQHTAFSEWLKHGFHIVAAPVGLLLCLGAGAYSLIDTEKGVQLFYDIRRIVCGIDAMPAIFPIEERAHFFGGAVNDPNGI